MISCIWVLLFSTISLLSLVPFAFAQQLEIGNPASHDSLEITISETDAHVVHIIKSGSIRYFDTVSGNISGEIKAVDSKGNDVQFARSGGEYTIVLFPSNDEITLSYTLKDVIAVINDTYVWDFVYLTSTNFFFPDDIDKVYSNGVPLDLSNTRGIKCHGCQVTLEYSVKENSHKFNAQWEEQRFQVEVLTTDEISNFMFNQSTKIIQFDAKHGDRHITINIPSNLLGGPYQVYVNELDMEILNREDLDEYISTIYIKPSSGTVTIIGATVIPEFPVYLLVLGISMSLVLLTRFNRFTIR